MIRISARGIGYILAAPIGSSAVPQSWLAPPADSESEVRGTDTLPYPYASYHLGRALISWLPRFFSKGASSEAGNGSVAKPG